MTQVFAISCLFSTLATNPTKAKHFLVETAKNGVKNDAKDYNDCNCNLQLQIAMNKYNKQATAKKEKEKGDCNKVFCCPVSELSKLLQRSILYSSLFQISASEVSHLLKAFHNPCFGNIEIYQLCQRLFAPISHVQYAPYSGHLLLRSSNGWRAL